MKRKILNVVRDVIGTNRLFNLTQNLFELRRFQLIEHIMHDTEKGVSSEQYTDHQIIVSLTTYGKRIYDVAFTVESIMQQSIKANRIILWLDYSYEEKQLPQYLLRQQERGLEIAFCKDIRSYKKLVPALCCCPDAAIVTVDDDVLYDPDFLERLILSYLDDPHYIYCHRYHKMTFNKKGELKPYNKWDLHCKDEYPSHLNFATGVGGVLYPPHSLAEEVINESVFMNICSSADDVWFKAMAIKKGTMVKKVYSRREHSEEYILNTAVQDIGLRELNTKGEMLNDTQINAVFKKYDILNNINNGIY